MGLVTVFGILAFYNSSHATVIHGVIPTSSYDRYNSYHLPWTTTYYRNFEYGYTTTTPANNSEADRFSVYQNFNIDCADQASITALKVYIPNASRWDGTIEARLGYTTDFGGYGFEYNSPHANLGDITWRASSTISLLTPGWQTFPFTETITCGSPINIFQLRNNDGTLVNPVVSFVHNSYVGGSQEVAWDFGQDTLTYENDHVKWNNVLAYPRYLTNGTGFDIDYYFEGSETAFTMESPINNYSYNGLLFINGHAPSTVSYYLYNQDHTYERYNQITPTSTAYIDILDLEPDAYWLTASSSGIYINRRFRINHTDNFDDAGNFYGDEQGTSTQGFYDALYPTSTEAGSSVPACEPGTTGDTFWCFIKNSFVDHTMTLRPFSYIPQIITATWVAMEEASSTSWIENLSIPYKIGDQATSTVTLPGINEALLNEIPADIKNIFRSLSTFIIYGTFILLIFSLRNRFI